MLGLASRVTELPRVGDVMAKNLQKLGIYTVADLLTHFPRTYDNQTDIRQIVYEIGRAHV